jgi:T5orf172 domain
MSQVGFVYILVNDYMPDVYKIGCTERSPHARADELSKHTGVPAPFVVLCYIEVENFQAVEKDMHKWMAKQRISPAREFFHSGLDWAVRLMFWHRQRISFCRPERCPAEYEWVEARESLDWKAIEHHTADPWHIPDSDETLPEPTALKLVAAADGAEAAA